MSIAASPGHAGLVESAVEMIALARGLTDIVDVFRLCMDPNAIDLTDA